MKIMMVYLLAFIFALELAACFSPATPEPQLVCEDQKDEYFCRDLQRKCKTNRYVQSVCKRTCGLCETNPNVGPLTPIVMPHNPFLGRNCPPMKVGVLCAPGQIQHYPKGSCSPICVPMPQHGCRPVYEHITLDRFTYNNKQCSTITPIVKSKCIGVCASTSVYSLSRRQEKEMCFCCKSNRMMEFTALFKCQGSHQPVEHRYSIITSCGCNKCESMMKMAAFGGPGQTISMDEEDFSKDISGAVESFNA